ncbi:conserved hypothetical protein [Altererythrobacter sp. B11]|uniref:glycosyltransferase family 4 protein n=1 Tax=Altererythrobacter sp. B11 TaxID=2060312 RepID=UPI000DC72BAA|nr:glycosyltransferase family 4 protein [Altererythrobacter sp. B11]BBC73976.1 conserved hypothetical protein [Altererythrobacter sp. B11]
MQYLPALAKRGVKVEVAPFFDDRYLERLYSGRATGISVAHALVRRVSQLRSTQDYDVIWLEKEALPWLPWIIERALFGGKVPIVTDYDDAIFHRYDQHRNGVVRAALGKKIDKIMAASALVVAGNAYLAARAEAAGARAVRVVPTVVDYGRYAGEGRTLSAERPKIGWIGTPGTWASYMEPLRDCFLRAAESGNAELLAVGAGNGWATHPRLAIAEWSEATEVDRIRSMDIGIMPLDDTPWSRGKCGYKLIQYMACGVPVVASPVGVNSQIVRHGINGFLASSECEWEHYLTRLLSDSTLRERMGEAGRIMVAKEFSLDAQVTKIADALEAARR